MISVGPSCSTGPAGTSDGGVGEGVPEVLGGAGERPVCPAVAAAGAGAGAAGGAGLGDGAGAAAAARAGAGAAAGAGAGAGVGAGAGAGAGAWAPVGAGAPVPAGAPVGAGTAAGAAAPAIGRSTWRSSGIPQLGQKPSSLLWMAAQRGHAVMPASRRTVTDRRSSSAPSSARSSVSMWPSVVSLARTRASLRWPNRCRLKTRPPRSR